MADNNGICNKPKLAKVANLLINFEALLKGQRYGDERLEQFFFLIMSSCQNDETMLNDAFASALELLEKYRPAVAKKIALEIIDPEKFTMSQA